MKALRTVVALWMCLIFASSGLSGLVLCIDSHGGICLKMEEADGACEKPSTHGDENHQDHDDQSRSSLDDGECCYICVNIPLSGDRIPECTVSKVKVTKISKARVAACLNGAFLSYIGQSTASALCSSRPVLGTAARPDRTVVLRI